MAKEIAKTEKPESPKNKKLCQKNYKSPKQKIICVQKSFFVFYDFVFRTPIPGTIHDNISTLSGVSSLQLTSSKTNAEDLGEEETAPENEENVT